MISLEFTKVHQGILVVYWIYMYVGVRKNRHPRVELGKFCKRPGKEFR